MYALPAWGGFLTVELSNKIDIFLRKAVKCGYAQKVTSLSELLRNADEKLFSKMSSSNHSIHQLLPPAKTLPMKLRSTHNVITTCINLHLFCEICFWTLIEILCFYTVFITFVRWRLSVGIKRFTYLLTKKRTYLVTYLIMTT